MKSYIGFVITYRNHDVLHTSSQQKCHLIYVAYINIQGLQPSDSTLLYLTITHHLYIMAGLGLPVKPGDFCQCVSWGPGKTGWSSGWPGGWGWAPSGPLSELCMWPLHPPEAKEHKYFRKAFQNPSKISTAHINIYVYCLDQYLLLLASAFWLKPKRFPKHPLLIL